MAITEFTDPEGMDPPWVVPIAPKFYEALQETLPTLPAQNLKFGRAVARAFAGSPNSHFRGLATFLVAPLTLCDRENGLRIWDRLMRDSEELVRTAAYEPLRLPMGTLVHIGDTEERIDMKALYAACTPLGIGWQDALRLTAARTAAIEGQNVVHTPYHPNSNRDLYNERLCKRGRQALSRLLELALLGGRVNGDSGTEASKRKGENTGSH